MGGLNLLIRNLKWRELSVWPPEWWISDQGAGEEGVLEEVQLCQDTSPVCISVVASYLGDSRKGVILLEDLAHLRTLYNLLRANIGRPLTEIGNLELNLFPPLKGPKRARPRQPSPSKAAKKDFLH
jgi:hypothetical protein